jgi:hypothetical protein
MNSYVVGYKIDIEFGSQPSQESRYPSRGLAEAACRDLNGMGVRTDKHHCSFAVERLREGDFGIICVCHPLSHPSPQKEYPRQETDKSRTA